MSLLEIKNFSLSFGEKVLFSGADFFVNKGDKIGLVGVNGAGKSTLLKIVNKKILQDTGTFEINPKIKLGYLDQQALINSEKSVFDYLKESFSFYYEEEHKMEECYNKMSTAKTEQELAKLSNKAEFYMKDLESHDFYNLETTIKKVADGLGVTAFGLDTKVKTLSGGQREKVKLSKLLLEQPDILLLDEPTNFLDAEHIKWLTAYLLNFQGSFVTVSHDENFLRNVANCICDVDMQKITRYNVGFNKFLEMKALAKEQQQKDYERQQKKIASMENLIDRFRYKATKASMVQSRIKTLEKMEKVEPPTQNSKPTFLFNYKKLNSKVLLEANNLVIGYDKPLLCKKINILLNRGEKLAITGFNGIGKSTLLKTISGIIPAIDGTYKLGTNVVIGYYEQDLIFKDPEQTPVQFIIDEYPHLTEKDAKSNLARCGLKAEHVRQPIKKLSGGEQSKIKICKLMLYPCNILILDEPTSHMDHNAIERLSYAIKKFEGTVLFVSHEADFVKENADQVLSLESLLN